MGYKVYKYTFPNGKVYIGMTHLSLAERRDNGYQHNKSLQEAIRKYGWRGFTHEVIADGLSKEDAERMEMEQISLLNADDPSIGYNISRGGSSTFLGLKHTKESKEKISTGNLGKIFSDEQRRRLSEAHKGKRIGRDNHKSKTIHQFDLNGNYIAMFESIRQASILTGVNRCCISDCINGKQNTSGGFIWKVR